VKNKNNRVNLIFPKLLGDIFPSLFVSLFSNMLGFVGVKKDDIFKPCRSKNKILKVEFLSIWSVKFGKWR